MGSYDLFYPWGQHQAVRRRHGRFDQNDSGFPGFSRDSHIGYATAALLQQVSQNTCGSYYLRSNASTEMSERGGSKQGSLSLNSSGLPFSNILVRVQQAAPDQSEIVPA